MGCNCSSKKLVTGGKRIVKKTQDTKINKPTRRIIRRTAR